MRRRRPELAVLSLDVFDTLVVRCHIHALGLWAEVGRSLPMDTWTRSAWTSSEFPRLRLEAWEQACLDAGVADVPLQAVYERLATRLRLPPGSAALLVAAEVDAELAGIRPVPEVLERVRQLVRPATQVVLTSETSLPNDVVRRAIGRAAPWLRVDRVVTSGEFGASKRSGELFDRTSQGPLSAPALHIGDDDDADGAARRRGFETLVLDAGRPNRFERVLADVPWLPPVERSLFAGAARLARLEQPSDGDSAVIDVATGVAGPALLAYVLWVLFDAGARGIARLYFLSRDGFILQQLAASLVQRLDLAIQTSYLYVSREALHSAAIVDVMDPQHVWLRDDLAAGSVEREEAVRLAPGRRSLAAAYLRSKGMAEGVPSAIVDVGWRGRLQHSLGRIAAIEGLTELRTGYYFALDLPPSTHDDSEPVTLSFMADPSTQGRRRAAGDRCRPLMEVFTAAPHGRVRGYEARSGQVVPVFAAEDRDQSAASLVAAQLASIQRFVDSVPDSVLRVWPTDTASADSIAELLLALITSPSRAHAEAYGAYQFDGSALGGAAQPLAQPYSWNDAARFLLRRRLPNRHVHDWPEASARLSGRVQQRVLRASRRFTFLRE